jgi:hypothetical protein
MKKKFDNIWHKLKVGQFQEIQTLGHLEPFDQLKTIVAIVDELSMSKVDEMPMWDVQKRGVEIMDQLQTMEHAKWKTHVYLDGTRYKIIRMFDEITTGQFVEYNHWIHGKTPAEIIGNLHLIIATLLTKHKYFGKCESYDGTAHKERSELVQNHMKIIDAMGIANFFLATWIQFVNNIPEFSKVLMKQAETEMTKQPHLSKITDG